MGNSENKGDIEQAIRNRAYAIWEDKGRPDGEHLDHWRQAIKEVERAKEAPETLRMPRLAA
jgi:hypothetical protein